MTPTDIEEACDALLVLHPFSNANRRCSMFSQSSTRIESFPAT